MICTPRVSRFIVFVFAFTCLTGSAAAAAFTSGTALRRALPSPWQKTLAGTTEFTGLDSSGKVAIGVVRASAGGVVAYVCNGRRISRWFTGNVKGSSTNLQGRAGAQATISFNGNHGTAVVKLGTTTLHFKLQRARKGLGLRRLVTS